MNIFDNYFELTASIVFLIVGIWATAYGYGLVGDRLIGSLRWNANFKRQLRWLGPLLIVFCVAAFFI